MSFNCTVNVRDTDNTNFFQFPQLTQKNSLGTKIFSYKKLIRKILQHIDIEKIEQRIDFKTIFVTIARWYIDIYYYLEMTSMSVTIAI